MDLNKHILMKQGLTEEDIQKMEADPSASLLEPNENALLAFVIRSIKDPGSASEADIAKLKELGWEDRDIFDALAQGIGMVDHAIMMQVFQVDQNCLIDG